MNSEELQQLRQLMHETVLLPSDDSKRRQVEAKIAKAGTEAEKEWLTLLREDEQLRLELMRISVPDGFEESLLSIPTSNKHPQNYRNSWVLKTAIGILFMLCIPAIWWIWQTSNLHTNLHTLALLAMNDHVEDMHLAIETNDIHTLEQKLKNQLPFDLSLPNLGSEFLLLGGRKCVLGTHPVLYSLWHGPGGKYTLFQIQPEDFALDHGIKKTIVQPKGPATQRHPCEVLIWTENQRGYVVVADHGDSLNRMLEHLR